MGSWDATKVWGERRAAWAPRRKDTVHVSGEVEI